MEMKSIDQPSLYPSLEPLNASAPNAYDNLPDGQNAGGETADTFRLHKINEIFSRLSVITDRVLLRSINVVLMY
jgi:hypothetical protein